MTKITLICENCSNPFERVMGEYNRQVKKRRKLFFCSLSCASSHRNKNMTIEQRKSLGIRLQGKNKGNTYGKKSDFTYYLNKARNRKHESNMTDEYLSRIWTGKCAITNVPIFLKNHKTQTTPSTASLDRIDSTKGYVEGNVQFVAYAVNLAKSNFSSEDFNEFLQTVYNSRFKSLIA